MRAGGRSGRGPVRPDRPGHAFEGALDELADQEPRRIDRTRHGGAALGNALESRLTIVGLVTHQDDEPVPLRLRASERARDQGVTDAAFAEWRLDRERAEQQRLALPDANRREPDRTDQQG